MSYPSTCRWTNSQILKETVHNCLSLDGPSRRSRLGTSNKHVQLPGVCPSLTCTLFSSSPLPVGGLSLPVPNGETIRAGTRSLVNRLNGLRIVDSRSMTE